MKPISFEISNGAVSRWLWSRWKPALATGLAIAVPAVAVSFLVPKRYTATSTFTVASDRGLSSLNRLAGFAAQLGIAGSISSPASPDYFAQIAGVREVMLEMLADTACVLETPCRPLGQLLFGGSPEEGDRLALEKRIKKLAKMITVTVDPRTGVIRLHASARTPERAEAVLTSQLSALSRFVLQRRESQARNERIFSEKRLVELEEKRKDVVAKMTKFYETNRSFSLSPELRFHERELQDELSLWQELIQSVAREGELARLNEVRDIPAITVLEQPYASRRKTAPRRSLWAAIGFLAGAMLGLRPDRLVRDYRRAGAEAGTPLSTEQVRVGA